MQNEWEVLFHLVVPGNSSPDGWPVRYLPPGAHIRPGAMHAWIHSHREPPSIAALAPGPRAHQRWYKEQMAALLDPNATPRSIGRRAKVPDAEAEKMIAGARRRKLEIDDEGYDSNWGARSLRAQGIVRVNMTPLELATVFSDPIDEAMDPLDPAAPGPPAGPFPHDIVTYRTFLTPDEIVALQDDELYVPVVRTGNARQFQTVFETMSITPGDPVPTPLPPGGGRP